MPRSHLRRTQSRRPVCARRHRQLLFEQFEGRQLLAGVWDGGGGVNNWHTAANWDDNVVPGVGATVGAAASIGAPFSGVTISSASDVTVSRITSEAGLSITAGTFRIGSSSAASTFNNVVNVSATGVLDLRLFQVDNAIVVG